MPDSQTRLTSFGDLVRSSAEQRGDSLAVVDSYVRWTWAQLEALTSKVAAGLLAFGLLPGDRVAIQSATSADFLAVYLASLEAGLVVVPINPSYTVPELSHILSDSGARLLVTSSALIVSSREEILAAHPALEKILEAVRSASDELPVVTQLLEAGNAGDDQPAVHRGHSLEDLAVLLYTSGTSGRPKGAMLPVRALLANLNQLSQVEPAPVTSSDRLFLPLPLFHIYGLNGGLGLALHRGATLVLASKFDAAVTLQTMAEERATVVLGAPAEFEAWAEQESFADGFAHVRFALSGSAPLNPALVARYAQIGVPLFEGYGLTEASPVVSLNLIPDEGVGGWAEPKAGSIGRPLPGVEMRLIDSDGEEVEVGDLGRVEVRGDNLFLGYWPDGSDGPSEDGWFATGDLAVCDDDGDYYLVGRQNDLVLVNGFNVYPAEVEAAMSKLAGVGEVAVLGESDGSSGEVVVAYVVPKSGVVLDPDELLRQAGDSLAHFKLPRRIVQVDALPYTATGKVMKWRLRGELEDAEPEPESGLPAS
jgi:long-chain acyl-CoA synthetase